MIGVFEWLDWYILKETVLNLILIVDLEIVEYYRIIELIQIGICWILQRLKL